MLPSLPKDVRWGSFVTHSFLPHGDKRTPTDVCGEAICYLASRSFFLAWLLSFTKLLVLNSLAFMVCLLPRRNSRGVNKPARRMGDANDSTNVRSVQPCRKETSARRVYYLWKNVFSSLLFPRETWIPSKNDSSFCPLTRISVSIS